MEDHSRGPHIAFDQRRVVGDRHLNRAVVVLDRRVFRVLADGTAGRPIDLRVGKLNRVVLVAFDQRVLCRQEEQRNGRRCIGVIDGDGRRQTGPRNA